MPQPDDFTVSTRISAPTSPYQSYNTTQVPSPPISDVDQSINTSPNVHDVKNSNAASSTDTLCSNQSAHTKATTSPKLDFQTLETIFKREASADSPPCSPSLWYILTTALLLAYHKEKLVGSLWKHLSNNTAPSKTKTDAALLAIARIIREACLKASTLVGFPRAINALLSLQDAIKSTHPSLAATLSADSDLSVATGLTPSQTHARGLSLFQRIYAHHTPSILASMSSISGGPLATFAVDCIYGELLSDSRHIGDAETGVLEFVCCLADGVAPQAKGHCESFLFFFCEGEDAVFDL